MTIKTTAGPVVLARAQAARCHRGVRVPAVRRAHVTKAKALESLVIASYIRGLPVRDVEATPG